MWRPVSGRALALTFVLSLTVPPAVADAAPMPVRAQITATACGAGYPAGTTCGRARLPLDYDRPRGSRVSVFYAKIPARGRPRATLIPFAGGPGGALSAFKAELGQVRSAIAGFDILAVDVRGTGRSTFLRCRALDGELLAGPQAIAANGRCGRQIGPRRDFFNTTASAVDIESIRRTLALRRPRLLGFSYGTFLATAYLRLFPRVAQGTVLDGAYPVRGDVFRPDLATGTTRVARLLCQRSGACDPATAAAAIATVAADLRRAPRPLTGARQQLTESLFATVIGPLLQTGAPAVVEAVVNAAAGNYTELERLTVASIVPPPGDSRDFSVALAAAVQCNDYDYAYDVRGPLDRRQAALDTAVAALPDDVFGPFSKAGWLGLGNDHPSTCLRWPRSRTPVSQRVPTGSLPRTPVVVLNGDFDLQTPIEGARAAAATFARSVFIEIPNGPHVTIFADPCAQKVAFGFLVTLRLPSAGACRTAAQ